MDTAARAQLFAKRVLGHGIRNLVLDGLFFAWLAYFALAGRVLPAVITDLLHDSVPQLARGQDRDHPVAPAPAGPEGGRLYVPPEFALTAPPPSHLNL